MFEDQKGFYHRVENSINTGTKLSREDSKKLMDLLEKFMEKERIYASAILSLLGKSNPSKEQLNEFIKIIDNAIQNIRNGEPAFSNIDEDKLVKLFSKMGLSKKAAMKFIYDFTLIRGEMIYKATKETMMAKSEGKIERVKEI